jgi:hypothetical protein
MNYFMQNKVYRLLSLEMVKNVCCADQKESALPLDELKRYLKLELSLVT